MLPPRIAPRSRPDAAPFPLLGAVLLLVTALTACAVQGSNGTAATTSEALTPTTEVTTPTTEDPPPKPIDLHRLAPEASLLGPSWTFQGFQVDGEEEQDFFNDQLRHHCPDLLEHTEAGPDFFDDDTVHAVYRSGPRWAVMEIGPYPSEALDRIPPFIVDANRCQFEFEHEWIEYSVRYEGTEDIGVGDWGYLVSVEIVATYPHGTETGEPYGPVTAWARTVAVGVGELAVVINLEDGVDPDTGDVHATDEEELLRWAAALADSLEEAQQLPSS